MAPLKTVLVSALLVLLAVSSAVAQPCIECKDCDTNSCWRTCEPTCPTLPPDPPMVSGDACRVKGVVFGKSVTKEACATTIKYCTGGVKRAVAMPMALAARPRIGLVTRPQCSNIAYGQCQKTAMDTLRAPCGDKFNTRFRECSPSQFMTFYTNEVNDRCSTQAAGIPN